MHKILTRSVIAAFLTVAAVAAEAAGQAVSPEMAAVNTVLDFRLNWMEDTTRFNACSVYGATGRPADFPSGILPPLARGLDRTSGPCDGRSARTADAWAREVLLDSIAVAGDTAVVYLTIRKGEVTYREEYSLVNPSGNRWGMRAVRTWGAIRTHPSRRTSQKPPE